MKSIRLSILVVAILCLLTAFALTSTLRTRAWAQARQPNSVRGLLSPVSPGIAWFQVPNPNTGSGIVRTHYAARVIPAGPALADGERITNPATLAQLRPPTGPGVGVFHIETVHSKLCVEAVGSDGFFDQGHLIQQQCRPIDPDHRGTQEWAILPFAKEPGLYTIRGFHAGYSSGLDPNVGSDRVADCATIASDVLVGPARVNYYPCKRSHGLNWTFDNVGGEDQRFWIQPAGGFVYQIVSKDRKCWDVRGDSLKPGGDLIFWECNRQENQRFLIIPVAGEITQRQDADALREEGWSYSAADRKYLGGPGVVDVDLPGGDLEHHDAASSTDCARACVGNGSCKAWTWTPPGFNRADRGVCWLKNEIPAPVSRRDVRSRIVRPYPGEAPGFNVALESNGASATASSIFDPNFAARGAIDGDRIGVNWGHGGGWNDATPNVFPDELVIDFHLNRTIHEVDVFTVQDDSMHPSIPTADMRFTRFGLTAYEVQFWNGTGWTTFPGGNITRNDLVWRKVVLAEGVTTSKIRIFTHGSIDGYSRIVEVQAFAGN